jgi:hypothetical protein
MRSPLAFGHDTVAWKLVSASRSHKGQWSFGSKHLMNFAHRVGSISLANFQVKTLTLGGTSSLQTLCHSFLSPSGAELDVQQLGHPTQPTPSLSRCYSQ